MSAIHPSFSGAYEDKTQQRANPVHQIRDVAVCAGKGMLGAVLLVIGVALSLTLFLIPLGVPLALLGIAFLSTSGEAIGRRG